MAELETHPWQPWLPQNSKILFLGTFPPGEHRWSMPFYYPNPTNDFWRIIGLLLFGDKLALYDSENKKFNLARIKAVTSECGIALGDTAKSVRRLKGNASDKFLEIVEPIEPMFLLEQIPLCTELVATGEKAATVLSELTGVDLPKMGKYVEWQMSASRIVRIWRMPSTSRAYPLKVELKAGYYKALFEKAGILQ